jgi:hypothetical protein
VLHTIDYRHALANPASADERKRGRDLSRLLARDQPLAHDLAANLLDTADRLSAGRDASGPVASAAPATSPPAPPPPPPAPPVPTKGGP